MPRALKLTRQTIFKIDDETTLTWGELNEELNTAEVLKQTRYFVLDITINGIYYPWINVREDYFLEHFTPVDTANGPNFAQVTYIPGD